jgi:hypothetical protein
VAFDRREDNWCHVNQLSNLVLLVLADMDSHLFGSSYEILNNLLKTPSGRLV